MTIKQQMVAKKLSENISLPVQKAMIEAGYSESSARRSTQLTRSKSWPELMEKYMPDNFLQKQHKKLLNKKEFMAIGDRGDRHIEPTGEIDPQAVAKGLDMAYKLKGKYPASAADNSVNVAVVNVLNYAEAKKDDNVAE